MAKSLVLPGDAAFSSLQDGVGFVGGRDGFELQEAEAKGEANGFAAGSDAGFSDALLVKAVCEGVVDCYDDGHVGLLLIVVYWDLI